MMTPLELEQALDRWGTDLDQWPEGEADRVRPLLAEDEEARRLLQSARAVDDFLAGLRPHTPPDYLAGRIVARAAGDAAPDLLEQVLGWLTARAWRPALFALLLTGAGFLTGTMVTEPGLDPVLAEEAMTLAFSDIYGELENAQP